MSGRTAPHKNPAPDDKPLQIVLVSGGTGRTAEAVLSSAMAQFGDKKTKLIRRIELRSADAAVEIVREAAAAKAVLIHTLVEPEVRDALVREAERRGVPAVDVLGPVLSVLDDYLGPPQRRPGLSYELNKERFDRIDAVDFTLAHDDGLRLRDLPRADVVLVGVSRVAKSVTCCFLASHGVRAANVPIVMGIEPPAELLRLDPRKVIGLTMNAQRLQAIRTARVSRMGVEAVERYDEIRLVADELRYAQQLMTRHEWRCIDVSYKAVEEVTRDVLGFLGW